MESKKRNPFVAFLLSLFITGFGHFYLGKYKTALIFYSIFLIFIGLIFFSPIFISFKVAFLIISLYLIFRLFVAIHSLFLARKPQINDFSFNKWYCYLLIVILEIGFEFIIFNYNQNNSKTQTFSIPTTSMSPNIDAGDKVTFLYTNKIKLYDVVLFSYPNETNQTFTSRCVAMPGDTFEVKDGFVYNNSKLIDDTNNLKFRYFIKGDGNLEKHEIIKFSSDEMIDESKSNNYFGSELTKAEAINIGKLKNVKEITILKSHLYSVSENIFPFDTINFKWNSDYYGPIIIPEQDKEIILDSVNSSFYGSIIYYNENQNIVLNEKGYIELEGKILKSYIFKNNYYFMMGDNRHNSNDSRFRGLIPENLIFGKALYILYSKKINKIGNKL